jgi:hypothetical protein
MADRGKGRAGLAPRRTARLQWGRDLAIAERGAENLALRATVRFNGAAIFAIAESSTPHCRQRRLTSGFNGAAIRHR